MADAQRDEFEQQRDELLAALEEERTVALAESSLLTQLLLSCTSGDPESFQLVAFSSNEGGETGTPEDYDRMVSLEALVTGRNNALDSIRADQPDYSTAIAILEVARDDYMNSRCFRDLEWERTIRALSLCDVVDDRAPIRGWYYLRLPPDVDACTAGEPGADDLLFCDAIRSRSTGEYLVLEGKTVSTRLQQACNA